MHNKIAGLSQKITSVDVLQFIISNSSNACESGLLESLLNGLHYAETSKQTEKEKADLIDQYAGGISDAYVSNIVDDKCEAISECVVSKCVKDRSGKYGKDIRTRLSILDQVCEKEIFVEKEIEKEKHVEVEIPKANPFEELDWQYSEFKCGNWEKFVSLIGESHLKQLRNANSINLLTPEELNKINWGNNLFFTDNFILTVADSKKLDNYLRHVDFLLLFSDGRMVCISDREANGIIASEWEHHKNGQKHSCLLHSYVIRDSLKSETFQTFKLKENLTTMVKPFILPTEMNGLTIDIHSIASMLIFDGQTTYGPALKPAMDQSFKSREAIETALKFVKTRREDHLIDGSQLQKLQLNFHDVS